MFGIVYAALVAGAHVVKKVGDVISDEKCYRRDQNNGQDWYIDRYGRERLKKNGQVVELGFNGKGDFVMTDLNNKLIKNYSQEQRDNRLRTIQNKMMNDPYYSTVLYDYSEHDKWGEARGRRYKDKKTGEIYVIRELDNNYVYVNLNTRKIVRKTDCQKYTDSICPSKPQPFDIDYWNSCLNKDIHCFNYIYHNSRCTENEGGIY